jgi:hypothetical protein
VISPPVFSLRENYAFVHSLETAGQPESASVQKTLKPELTLANSQSIHSFEPLYCFWNPLILFCEYQVSAFSYQWPHIASTTIELAPSAGKNP